MYKTISLSSVLYGCETWSFALKEEHRLTIFEDRVQRKVFGPQRDGITREWRWLHKEELCYLYSSNIIRANKTKRIGWAGHVARLGERREQFPDINKVFNFASFWIYTYIGILLGAHPILHISRIKVNSRMYQILVYFIPLSKIIPKRRYAFCVEYNTNDWCRTVSDVSKMLLMNRARVWMQHTISENYREMEKDFSRKHSDFSNTI
jgi:hypothetical protein